MSGLILLIIQSVNGYRLIDDKKKNTQVLCSSKTNKQAATTPSHQPEFRVELVALPHHRRLGSVKIEVKVHGVAVYAANHSDLLHSSLGGAFRERGEVKDGVNRVGVRARVRVKA